ncbi:ABC transporter substrate-binding protein [Actinomadura craniellae]|uniref:Putative aliphatic sulfonates-binding protein n=1 Tax=Actinomadura craniellae TaxID=2231787 RepID=A0A365H6F9_9ACTN|nr:ABC transporter substrate-binding protein [Actinomadura craniellae]RAY14661.1 ABC transporter substrate-binding protein [Actinomadura craniellae]
MIKRLTALLAALTLTAAACGGTDGASNAAIGPDGKVDLSKVTLRIGDQKGASIQALLAAAGQLGGTQYKISWSLFTSGPPILEAINAGAVDFGAVGNTPPVFAAAARSRIVIVGATEQRLDGQAVVVPAGSPLRSPTELRGRKVAVAKGSSAHYHLLTVLQKNELSFKDIQPQFLQPADALAALTERRVDAWAVWEPYTAQAEHQAKARVLADGNGYTNGYGFQVTSRKALDDRARRAALADFLNRYRRAQLWVNGHQKEWAALWSKETGLPVPVAELAVRRRLARIIKIDDAVVTEEQRVADAFSAAGVLPGRVRFADYFDRRFNDSVQ